ncbi:archaemetzincin family Zn-dependent metalloprotease [Pyrococcus yayanosii]|uniref:Archaemetzincin n=1 Tax=Pyrococcus yayanosii (strain CH1 / JCM 16557) TaxID=529709 RepID=F8AFJ3_PYRYC|nr:archemetzincin-like protein [Pyrococcus yayanosii CH1]
MILVVPIGGTRAVAKEIAARVSSFYSPFGIKVEVHPGIPVDTFLRFYDPFRGQFLGRGFLPELSRLCSYCSAILGVVDLDLYEPGLNFIFGLANSSLRAAVIALPRLRPEFYGLAPDEKLFIERAVKEAMHELGHVFDLGHCPNPRCVMHFSNSILDTDAKGWLYCERCLSLLKKRLSMGHV